MSLIVEHTGIPWNILLQNILIIVGLWVVGGVVWWLRKTVNNVNIKGIIIITCTALTILLIGLSIKYIIYSIDYASDNYDINKVVLTKIENNNEGYRVGSMEKEYRFFFTYNIEFYINITMFITQAVKKL